MLIKLDKFFIAELNKNEINFDYKKLREIYLQSRKNPDCIIHQNHLKWEQGLLSSSESLSAEEFKEKYKDEIEDSRKEFKEEERKKRAQKKITTTKLEKSKMKKKIWK